MNKESMLLASALLLIATPALAQPGAGKPTNSASVATVQLLSGPEIDAVTADLRRRNLLLITTSQVVERTIYEHRTCRTGLFGRRIRTYCVPRKTFGTIQGTEQVDGLEDGIGWQDTSDPRLGYYPARNFTVRALPQAAGARASKISEAIERMLSDTLVSEGFGTLDRTLVRMPKKSESNTARRELVKVVATVVENDQRVNLDVLVQVQDETGTSIRDKQGLTNRAKAILDGILAELNK